jgi:hypothetical protein
MPVASRCDHTHPSPSWGGTTASKQSHTTHPSTTPKQTRLPHPLIHFWTTMEQLLPATHFQLSKCTTIGTGTHSRVSAKRFTFLDFAISGLSKVTRKHMLENCKLTNFHRSLFSLKMCQQFSPKRYYLFTELHRVMFQKTVIFILYSNEGKVKQIVNCICRSWWFCYLYGHIKLQCTTDKGKIGPKIMSTFSACTVKSGWLRLIASPFLRWRRIVISVRAENPLHLSVPRTKHRFMVVNNRVSLREVPVSIFDLEICCGV